MSSQQPMRSSVNWAVLGMLIERPSYGYELHQRLARRFPPDVLDPAPSHVYAALNTLEKRGFIEPLVGQVDDGSVSRRQPKLHYRATALGGREFRGWLAEQLRADPAHTEFVRRLALAAGMRRAAVVHELVDAFEDGCMREAHALPMPGADGQPARSADALMQRLTVGARRAVLDAQMAWMQHARKEIEAFERWQEQDG
jgi:DNA-binding PadR family transcriptional regulator